MASGFSRTGPRYGVYESWRYDEMSIGLLIIPIWIPQLAFAIGANVLLIAVIDELVAWLAAVDPRTVARR